MDSIDKGFTIVLLGLFAAVVIIVSVITVCDTVQTKHGYSSTVTTTTTTTYGK